MGSLSRRVSAGVVAAALMLAGCSSASQTNSSDQAAAGAGSASTVAPGTVSYASGSARPYSSSSVAPGDITVDPNSPEGQRLARERRERQQRSGSNGSQDSTEAEQVSHYEKVLPDGSTVRTRGNARQGESGVSEGNANSSQQNEESHSSESSSQSSSQDSSSNSSNGHSSSHTSESSTEATGQSNDTVTPATVVEKCLADDVDITVSSLQDLPEGNTLIVLDIVNTSASGNPCRLSGPAKVTFYDVISASETPDGWSSPHAQWKNPGGVLLASGAHTSVKILQIGQDLAACPAHDISHLLVELAEGNRYAVEYGTVACRGSKPVLYAGDYGA